jgi:flavin reductase (DIM6/NTAB) family NADH-FMN oxidoreductase RutF
MTYRTFDVAEIGHQQSYRLAIGSIVPRPIAWVSSMGADGVANLAPFSFFSLVSHYPRRAISRRPRATSSTRWSTAGKTR